MDNGVARMADALKKDVGLRDRVEALKNASEEDIRASMREAAAELGVRLSEAEMSEVVRMVVAQR